MRRSISSLMVMGLAAAIASLGVTVSANTGSVLIAHWRVEYAAPTDNQNSSIFVSNISSHDVQVTVRVYDKQGSGIGSIAGVALTTNGFASCNGANSSCTLEAGKSGFFVVTHTGTTVDTYGHGVIEWSNIGADNDSVALLVDGHITSVDAGGKIRRQMKFVGGQPF